MIKKVTLISLLGAIAFAGCSAEKTQKAPQEGEKKVQIGGPDKGQLKALQKYTRNGEWLLLDADGRRGYRKLLIGKGEGEQRVVELRPEAGYMVWLINIDCKRKAFRDQGAILARLSDGDRKLPDLTVDKNKKSPDVLDYLPDVCGETKSKSFRAPLIQAVSSLRSAESGKIQRPAPPPTTSKFGPSPSKMKVVGRDGKVTYQEAPAAITTESVKQK